MQTRDDQGLGGSRPGGTSLPHDATPFDATAGATGGLKDEVKDLAQGARDGAVRALDTAKERALGVATERKDGAASGLGGVADALRAAGDKLGEGSAAPLGQYAGQAAESLERAASYLRRQDLGAMVKDAEVFARRHPDLFLAGGVVAGVFLARFLKASRPDDTGSLQSGFTHAPVSATATDMTPASPAVFTSPAPIGMAGGYFPGTE